MFTCCILSIPSSLCLDPRRPQFVVIEVFRFWDSIYVSNFFHHILFHFTTWHLFSIFMSISIKILSYHQADEGLQHLVADFLRKFDITSFKSQKTDGRSNLKSSCCTFCLVRQSLALYSDHKRDSDIGNLVTNVKFFKNS